MPLQLRKAFAAPGSGPAGLAWDGANLWNADYRSGRLFGLDPHSGEIKLSLYCPGNLAGLAWDGSALWQSLFDEEMIRCVNRESNDFDDTILLWGRGWLSGVACDGRRLWTVAQQRGQLLTIDLESREVGPAVIVPVAVGDIDYRDGTLWASVAEPMRFDQAVGRFEWLTDSPRYAIVQLDPADGRELARHTAEFLYTGLCWVDDTLWLAHAGSRSLYLAELIA